MNGNKLSPTWSQVAEIELEVLPSSMDYSYGILGHCKLQGIGQWKEDHSPHDK